MESAYRNILYSNITCMTSSLNILKYSSNNDLFKLSINIKIRNIDIINMMITSLI